jgi:DNA repair protein RecN (Recombination protein N)
LVLHQLTIRDFAIIDRLDVTWAPGFNVITGETGAGKSIIIDAVGALLGDKVGPEAVRTGADRAIVEGVLVLGPEPPADLLAVLEEYGLEPEEGAVIITREVASAGGRGGARVNGRAVPLVVLQQLGEQLVDVHGQSQHMALLRVREQLEFLDRYAGVLSERARVAGLVRALRGVREEIRALQSEERQAARQQEILAHEIAEIERAALRDGEEEELQALRTRLRHVERLRESAMVACQALSGIEGEEGERPGAVDLLGQAVAACQDGAQFDSSLATEAENLTGALSLAEEAARTLRDYLESIEADPGALEQTEERLFAIADLKRKYGASVREILEYLANARRQLDSFEHRDERLAELADQERQLVAELATAASDLSEKRCAAGERLARAVEGELADLQMRGTRFRVGVTQHDDPDGIPFVGRIVSFDLTGVDRVEFLISPNPGEEPRPMTRVASGGELARIALALKTILSRADTRSTLIFDEVDSGVGGRTAPVVGQKLWSLAATGHQVLCVTHMPQVAAYADQHWVVAKQTAAGRTRTAITPLDMPTQIDELATMLAGRASESARDSARELLERAGAEKANGPLRPAPPRRQSSQSASVAGA